MYAVTFQSYLDSLLLMVRLSTTAATAIIATTTNTTTPIRSTFMYFIPYVHVGRSRDFPPFHCYTQLFSRYEPVLKYVHRIAPKSLNTTTCTTWVLHIHVCVTSVSEPPISVPFALWSIVSDLQSTKSPDMGLYVSDNGTALQV